MLEANKILVPVSGRATDERAVALACQTAKRSKASVVYVVSVIKVGFDKPLDADLTTDRARADALLDAAERVAEPWDVELVTEILQARDIGIAIVEEAIEAKADLIIVGIPWRQQFGEFELGTTVPYILNNAPCEVWFCREPMSARA